MKQLHNILLHLMSELQFTGACLDSRKVQPGNIFIAMVGEKSDGNDFITEAVVKGAVFVLCTREPPNIPVPYLVVNDPLEALTIMAQIHRSNLTCPVIALTGSNGKTTVKEMIGCILPQPSFVTIGNFNNHLGVPISILHWNKHHKYAVFELGANHVGEIAHTVSLVKPNVALINNIAPAHIDEFGGIENIVKTKGEIYAGLVQNGTAIINDDDFYAHAWDNLVFDHKVVRYSAHYQEHRQVQIYAQDLYLNLQGCVCFKLVAPQGSVFIELNVPGKHQVHNALAAAACCLAVGIDLDTIEIGLRAFTGVAGRLTKCYGKNNAIILDDTYNANLRSVLSALDVLSHYSGMRVLVLGDLGELGDLTQEHHEIIGVTAREYGIELVMTCGQHSVATTTAFGTPEHHYKDHTALLIDLLPYLSGTTTVLVKGSRSSRMENIVRHLCGE